MENKEDLYVIGFPKSGNTWLSRLLSDITNSKIYVASEDDVINNSENSDSKNGNYLIHKIHGTNNINDVMKSKKVYIVRDPRAVFVSGFFHIHRNIDEKKIVNSLLYKYFFSFEVNAISKSWHNHYRGKIRNFFVSKQDLLPPKKVGSWSNHVDFWTSQYNMVVIRYEDLLSNTVEVLKDVLSKLNITYSEDQLSRAIDNQSFENKKKKFLKSKDIENAKFLRSGGKDTWKSFLDDKLVQKIEIKHKKMMSKMQYMSTK